MRDLLGLVVLFHPDTGAAERIKTYLNEVSRLLVIDNSEPSSELTKALKHLDARVEVISNPSNMGMAHALNQGVEYGRRNGFSWLLTMDQDSAFVPRALEKMKELTRRENPPAVIAPVHLIPGDEWKSVPSPTTPLRVAMTSGNLLQLQTCGECGPFEEKLFIDSVDHEYCLRLRRKGYRIVRVNDALLHHNLGQTRKVKPFTRIVSHPASRRYYMTRNRLFVIARYMGFDPVFCLGEIVEITKSFFVVLLFENNKSTKLLAMARGVWHFIVGKYGKLTL